MSYAFSVKAATKADAKEACANSFDAIVAATQPIHKRDREAVLANANAVIDLLVDCPDNHIVVNLNGYVSWRGEGEAAEITQVSITAGAQLTAPDKNP